MNKKLILLACSILLIALFSGCTDSTVANQVAAIESAITETAEETDTFYFFKHENLEDQVKEQWSDFDNSSLECEYTIAVTVAPVDKIPDNALTQPEIEYTFETDLDTYRSAFLEEMTKTIETYIQETEDLEMEESSITVTLEKDEEEDMWHATLTDISEMAGQYTTDISAKAESLLEETDGYQFLHFVQELHDSIQNVFESSMYDNKLSVDSVKQSDDGTYAVTFSYPDPDVLFSTLYNKGYSDYETNGEIFFETTSDDAKTAMEDYLDEGLAETAMISSSINVDNATTAETEFLALLDKINTAFNEKASALAEQVNATFLIQPQEKPSTQVLSGDNTGQSIAIKTSTSFDLHLTFYKISGTDLTEEGTKTLSVYIVAGESITIRLPLGNYKLVQGMGLGDWYGEEYGFGTLGLYNTNQNLIEIKSGYEYTLQF